jgi:hypothetical protein
LPPLSAMRIAGINFALFSMRSINQISLIPLR